MMIFCAQNFSAVSKIRTRSVSVWGVTVKTRKNHPSNHPWNHFTIFYIPNISINWMGMVYSWVYRFTSPATESEMCFEFAIAFYGARQRSCPGKRGWTGNQWVCYLKIGDTPRWECLWENMGTYRNIYENNRKYRNIMIHHQTEFREQRSERFISSSKPSKSAATQCLPISSFIQI